jgi:hypothetical protein
VFEKCVRLQPGDIALGYDVASANVVDPELDKYRGLQLPDVILVRKSYAEKRRKRRQKGQQRPWTLQRMDVVEEEAHNKKQAAMHASHEAERERFLEVIHYPPLTLLPLGLAAAIQAERSRRQPPEDSHLVTCTSRQLP